MSENQIEHKLDTGILTIDIFKKSSLHDSPDDEYAIKFEPYAADVWFDNTYTRDDFGEICSILKISQELCATLEELPKIILENNSAIVAFAVAGRNTTYPAHLYLTKREYLADRHSSHSLDIIKLRAENAALSKKITNLEATVAEISTGHKKLMDKHNGVIDYDYVRELCKSYTRSNRSLSLDMYDLFNTSESSKYESYIEHKCFTVNDSIDYFLKYAFHVHDPFYPKRFNWDFDESMINRLKFMVANGLDMTQMMDDPNDPHKYDYGYERKKISLIDYVKNSISSKRYDYESYMSDPRHKLRSESGPINIPALLERLERGCKILEDSIHK